MVGPRNKYAMLFRAWYTGAPHGNVYWDGLYDSEAAHLFTAADLAHLFPGVKYKENTEEEHILRIVACMKYQVSESRFKWLVEMATKCMAEEELVDEYVEVEEELVDEYVEEELVDEYVEDILILDPEEYRCIYSEDESDRIVEKIIVEDDSSEEEEEEENTIVENDSSDKNEEASSDKKEEENSNDEKEGDAIVKNDNSEDAILARFKDLIVKNGSSEDSAILAKFLYDISEKYEGNVHKQLSELADYMSSAFSKVNGSQFQWMKMLKASSVERMEKVPLAKVPYYVYKRIEDWVNWRTAESLESFVLEILQTMCFNLAMVVENVAQRESSETEDGSFIVLALVLRLKPDVLISVWPTFEEYSKLISVWPTVEGLCPTVESLCPTVEGLCPTVEGLWPTLEEYTSVWPTFEEYTKYWVQVKVLVLAWAISQAYREDWSVGVFMWVRYLLPLLSNEPNLSPKSKDIITQVIDRIGFSKAPYRDPFDCDVRSEEIFYPSVVKNGVRVVPPSALELLVKSAFPADSEQRKATEMLRVWYRFLKNVALCASPGSEEAKRISEQLVPFAIKAAGEGNSYLAKKARHLFFWCLTNHHNSFKQWDDIYLENLDGSVFMLEKLSVKCLKMLSRNLSIFGPMIQTMKRVASKNEEALTSEHDSSHQATLEKAQNYTNNILEKAQGYVDSILGSGLDSTFGPGALDILLNEEVQTSGDMKTVLGLEINALVANPNVDMLLNEEVQTSGDIKTVLGPEITASLGNPKEVQKHLYNACLRATCYVACGVTVAYSLDHLRLI